MTRTTARKGTEAKASQQEQDSGTVATLPSADSGIVLPALTVEDARRTDWTEEQGDAFIAQAKGVAEGITRLGNDLMWQAALAVNGLLCSGQIGKGKRWESQDDYAGEWGASKGYVSKVVAIGRAAAVHGLQYQSDDYATFVKVVRGDGGEDLAAARKAVKDALKGEDSEAFRSGLGLYRKGEAAITARENAAKALKAAEATPGADASGDESGEESEESETRAPGGNVNVTTPEGERRDPRPTVGDVRAILNTVRSLLHRMTPAQQAVIFEDFVLIQADCEGRNATLGPVEETAENTAEPITGEVIDSVETTE